ncbi:MAG: hypothetical protein PHW73_07710 [Atribacterota bacterium]|nr:hypothetical protein [Atribacterota bacterium]
MGIGLVYKLFSLGKTDGLEFIYFALKYFTNIKFLRLWILFNKKEIPELIKKILEFNIPQNNNSNNKEFSFNKFIEDINRIISTIEYHYGYTRLYILENIDMYELDVKLQVINQHISDLTKLQALAFNNPKEAFKIADKMVGVEKLTMQQIRERTKKTKKQ